jgi:hypothetical protein
MRDHATAFVFRYSNDRFIGADKKKLGSSTAAHLPVQSVKIRNVGEDSWRQRTFSTLFFTDLLKNRWNYWKQICHLPASSFH